MEDLEKILETLKREYGISITAIHHRVQMERGLFYSFRRSTDSERKKELAQKIKAAYPEYFGDDKEETDSGKIYREEYEKLKDRTIEELTKERDILREQVNKLLNALIEKTK